MAANVGGRGTTVLTMRLEGMPIVVTGATGIPRAGAERFTAEGAQTILTLTGGINVSMGSSPPRPPRLRRNNLQITPPWR